MQKDRGQSEKNVDVCRSGTHVSGGGCVMAEERKHRVVTDIPAGLTRSGVDGNSLEVGGEGQRWVVAPLPGPWECFRKGRVKAPSNSGSPSPI